MKNVFSDRPAFKLSFLLAVMSIVCAFNPGYGQLLVDDFNRPDDNVVGNGWNETETIVPGSIRISANKMLMESNVAGRDRVSMMTPGTYEHILTNNPCMLEWSFSMRQNALNPTGFGNSAHGIATVIAGSNADLLQGQGYAVVLGSVGTNVNPLRLVRYSNGIFNNTITDIISSGNYSTEWLNVTVTYDPVSEEWELFQNGNSLGTAINSTYTSASLPFIGGLWNHGTVNSTRGHFDNFHVPFNCQSRVDFVAASSSVNSFAGGAQLDLSLVNPHFANDAQITIDLVSGDASVIGGWTSEVVIIPGGSTTGALQLDIPLNGSCIGDQELVFEIVSITGGSGTPTIGPSFIHTLTVIDDRSSDVQLLNESFETDGSGTRYTLNTPHSAPASGSYFLRGTSGMMVAAGGVNVNGLNGSAFIGAADLTAIAPDAEVIVTFDGIDILGVSDVNVDLRAGARYAALFDQAVAQRDYLFVEANVDGGGWTEIGAFRSHKENPFVDGWLAEDTDLNGVGDGQRLNQTLRNFTFPLNVSGEDLSLRIRVRSTDVLEDIYFDHVRVAGNLCRPYYFSQASGQETDQIWSPMEVGAPMTISPDRNTTLVIQDGHTVTSSGAAVQLEKLIVEGNAALELDASDWEILGSSLTNDGSITSTTGSLHIEDEDPVTMDGTGTYDLFDLTVNAPANSIFTNGLTIRGTLLIEAGSFDASAATVLLRSTASGTGRLGPLLGGADFLGDLTMERYIPAGLTNWRFLGSPVAGATIQNWQDDFFTAGYPGSHYPNFYDPPGSGIFWPSIRWYDETDPGPDQNDGLLGVTSTQSLAQGQGFAAWCGTNLNTTYAFTIDVTGTPHIAHSPITLPMTFTNTGVPSTDGYNLVSNPLPSPIDFALVSRGADVGNFYWIFDPSTGNNATWNGVVGTNGANGIIQSSQAFWLKADGPSVTTTVDENAKVEGNTGGLFGFENTDLPMIRLSVTEQNQGFSDEAVIVFGLGTPDVDPTDVPKLNFARPGAPSISSSDVIGNDLSINMYGMPNTSVSIPLAVQATVSGTHTIQANDVDVIAGLSCVRLEDLQENVMIAMVPGASYTFELEANGNDETRFILHLSNPIVRESNDVVCHGETNGSISVTLPDGVAQVTLMDAFSVTLQEQTSANVLFADLAAGQYMVKVASDAGCGDLTGNVLIGAPAAMEATFTSTDATCGFADGSIIAEVFGGVSPYSVSWSEGTEGTQINAGAGTYTLNVVDANGCEFISAPQEIDAPNAPVADFTTAQDEIYPGEAVSFINLSSNADAYTWNMGDGVIIEAPEVGYMYGLPGEYLVTLTAILGGCESTVTGTITVNTPTGVTELEQGDLLIWHHADNINIRHAFTTGEALTVELFDATGRLHASHTTPHMTEMLVVPAAGLSTGIWIVKLSNGTQTSTGRVFIAR